MSWMPTYRLDGRLINFIFWNNFISTVLRELKMASMGASIWYRTWYLTDLHLLSFIRVDNSCAFTWFKQGCHCSWNRVHGRSPARKLNPEVLIPSTKVQWGQAIILSEGGLVSSPVWEKLPYSESHRQPFRSVASPQTANSSPGFLITFHLRTFETEMQGTEPGTFSMPSTCSATQLWLFPVIRGNIQCRPYYSGSQPSSNSGKTWTAASTGKLIATLLLIGLAKPFTKVWLFGYISLIRRTGSKAVEITSCCSDFPTVSHSALPEPLSPGFPHIPGQLRLIWGREWGCWRCLWVL